MFTKEFKESLALLNKVVVGDTGFEPVTSCVSNTAESYYGSPLSDDEYAFVLVLLEKMGNEVLYPKG